MINKIRILHFSGNMILRYPYIDGCYNNQNTLKSQLIKVLDTIKVSQILIIVDVNNIAETGKFITPLI